MKINELVAKYEKNPRINLESELEVKKYINIGAKKKMADAVLSGSTQIVDGTVKFDTFTRYILFTIAVIEMHTNLEFGVDGENTATDDYDILCESGLLDMIINTFERDYEMCQEVLKMVVRDMIQNKPTIEEIVSEFFNDIENKFEEIISKFDVDSINNVFQDQDGLKKIMEFVNNN